MSSNPEQDSNSNEDEKNQNQPDHDSSNDDIKPEINPQARLTNNSSTSSQSTEEDQKDQKNEQIEKLKEDQKNIIKELYKKDKLVEGQTYYLVNSRWWQTWKSYVNYDYHSNYPHENPGMIDNRNLLDSTNKVKKMTHEKYDYMIFGPEIWNKLHEWYEGGPMIARPCIRSKYGGLSVEVRQMEIKLHISNQLGSKIDINCSKAVKIGEFLLFLVRRLSLDESKIRLWDFYGTEKRNILKNMDESLSDAGIHDGQALLIEVKKESGNWPSKKFYKTNFSSGTSYHRSNSPSDPGKTGLYNLGNTCFMNSALQCLSASVPLSDYFLDKKFKNDSDIRGENPLSCKGRLAEEYYNLVSELWSSNIGCAEPREFKRAIGKFAPQFSGFDQHDSQEFLSYLLDGLHEDLNRVKKKPYVDKIESNGREDGLVATESWVAHRKRNDSIVVDLFQGQLKSTVTCPDCKNKSITFDPFMYLSVPLPISKDRVVEVLVFRADTSVPPMRYGVKVDKKGRVSELRTSLGQILEIKEENILILELFNNNNRFRRIYTDNDKIEYISDNEVVYAIEILPKPKELETIKVFVVNRKIDSQGYSGGSNLIGTPLVINIPKTITYRQLYKEILNAMKFFLVETPTTEIELGVNEDTVESSSDDDYRHKPTIQTSNAPKYGAVFNIIPVDDFGYPKKDKKFKNNDQPIKIKDGHTIAANWTGEFKTKYYKNYDMREFEKHQSLFTSTATEELNIENCLKLFTVEEQLGPNDTWYCGHCKDHKQAFKKFDIWSVPPLLVVHLKRFSYYKGVFREKLESYVDFPFELDLTGKIISHDKTTPLIYELYAVSNHFGGLGGGHYTAYAKHREGNWYQYDDSHVSQCNGESVKTKAAYVLFYKKKDLEFKPYNKEWDSKKDDSSSDSADSDEYYPLADYIKKVTELEKLQAENNQQQQGPGDDNQANNNQNINNQNDNNQNNNNQNNNQYGNEADNQVHNQIANNQADNNNQNNIENNQNDNAGEGQVQNPSGINV